MAFHLNISSALKFLLLLFIFLPYATFARKHNLHLTDDTRRLIHITSFGFFKGGFMKVTVNEIYLHPNPKPLVSKTEEKVTQVAFTVDRTLKDGINPYPHDVESACALNNEQQDEDSNSKIKFTLDFANKAVNVQCSPALATNVNVFKSTSDIPFSIQGSPNRAHSTFGNIMTQQQRKKRNAERTGLADNQPVESPGGQIELSKKVPGLTEVDPGKILGEKELPQPDNNPNADSNKPGADSDKIDQNKKPEEEGLLSSEESAKDDIGPHKSFMDPSLTSQKCQGVSIPLNQTTLPTGITSYSFTFVVYIAGEDCEGLYNLYFHNCAEEYGSRVTLNVSLVEENLKQNYLSAGEMPLPALYFMMSVLFFMAGCFWIFILKKSKRETGVSVFKIHYLMGALVFLKSLSLFFHSVNYHFIQIEGTHVEGWAVLYYIAHLLKGALLFITILLIGTGYAFVKHLLSDKDKKIFMIVIPLQVLANVAQIIIEESEEGEVVHTTWQVIFISVDLLCCCAILFPVVWSIRHLQEASQTDGKAASNLRKLKLFRHFYIIVVCYIYFTRIIVQMLLKITVPFQYEWLDDMFREMTTFIFFILTGYKFRPAANNPYLELAHDSDDEDMDMAMTDSGLTEGAVKRGYKPKKKTLKEIVLFDPNEEETDDDEEVLLEKRREASHDLD